MTRTRGHREQSRKSEEDRGDQETAVDFRCSRKTPGPGGPFIRTQLVEKQICNNSFHQDLHSSPRHPEEAVNAINEVLKVQGILTMILDADGDGSPCVVTFIMTF